MNIKDFQAHLGVNSDGVAGPVTFSALFAKCGALPERAEELGISAAVHFFNYGIMENGLRLAHFMAQLMHESGKFRYMEEIASGSAYEGRKDLGNIIPGDGKRYKGRGPIQLTGRTNYRRYGRATGLDLERHPELAAFPCIGLWMACEYWDRNSLNKFADNDDVKSITRRINGGYNGLADRQHHLAQVKEWLT